MKKILSICTGAGLLDAPFLKRRYEVVPGCEIDPDKRRMYRRFARDEPHLCDDLRDLPALVSGQRFWGIIGGPPCQSLSRTKNLRQPKYPDLTPQIRELLKATQYDWFLFENVAPLGIPGARHTKLDACNFPVPHVSGPLHQSRARWFTHSPNIEPPPPAWTGGRASIIPHRCVVGRNYGVVEAAALQGWPEFARIKEGQKLKVDALANGVPRGLAEAWARSVDKYGKTQS